ncbi:MAG: HEAT repeat domain-containing protein [Deltaproteobacteria bacterium]|nr:MAG: HEAT repeat domain-containing protein [Deltaproteobacteria bacterium]
MASSPPFPRERCTLSPPAWSPLRGGVSPPEHRSITPPEGSGNPRGRLETESGERITTQQRGKAVLERENHEDFPAALLDREEETLHPSGETEPIARNSWPSIFLRLLLLPTGFVLILFFVFYFFGGMELGPKTPEAYVQSLKFGGEEERLQAAYELHLLAEERPERLPATEAFVAELLPVVEGACPQEKLVCHHLVLTLGRIGNAKAIPALLPFLSAPDATLRGYVVWALGAIGHPSVVAPILTQLAREEDESVRSVGIYALGLIEDERVLPFLQESLHDPSRKIAWNAALSLARHGDPTGIDVIGQLLQRDFLEGIPDMTPTERSEAMINAIRALSHLHRTAEFRETLEHIIREDPDLKVRQAAIEARQKTVVDAL